MLKGIWDILGPSQRNCVSKTQRQNEVRARGGGKWGGGGLQYFHLKQNTLPAGTAFRDSEDHRTTPTRHLTFEAGISPPALAGLLLERNETLCPRVVGSRETGLSGNY